MPPKRKIPKGLQLAINLRFLRDFARLIPPEYPEDLVTVNREIEAVSKQLYRLLGIAPTDRRQ